MLTVLIEDITAAYRWARAARAYIATGHHAHRGPRAGLHDAGFRPCP